jgi:hypothetical protein
MRGLLPPGNVSSSGRSLGRFFFYDASHSSFDAALDWLRAHAQPADIVATSAPHYAYLRTGLPAVLPPLEADPAEAQRLLDSVPARYVVVDAFRKPDLARRHGAPVIRDHSDLWQEVYASPTSALRVYRRTARLAAAKVKL